MRVLLETGTESEWVAQTIEAAGHEVVIADPNYALMYGVRVRAVKTDRRDVAALAEACRVGIYRAAHRASAAPGELRLALLSTYRRVTELAASCGADGCFDRRERWVKGARSRMTCAPEADGNK